MTVRLGAVGAGWWATSNHFPIFAARDEHAAMEGRADAEEDLLAAAVEEEPYELLRQRVERREQDRKSVV